MSRDPQPYDLVIVGASFAGLAAAKTAAMRGLRVAVLEANPSAGHSVKTAGILFSEAERQALQHIKDWGFTDTFRLHTQEGGHYSWWDYRAGGFRRNLGLRIDHIWVSQPLAARNCKTWIDKEPRGWERPSDHAPVVAEFEYN